MQDTNHLKEMYRQMLRIRMIEEKIAALYAEQEMRCPVHLCVGQEAVAVGVCASLSRDDLVLSGHRSHGHYLAKGGNLRAMMAEIYGKATGCSQGKGGSMHLIDLDAGFLGATPIVGATIPVAVGAAWGTAMRGEPRVAVAFFGEGATEEGVFHESLNFAALKNVPVVFVCENNLYSVYSPLRVRQPEGRDLIALARAHGLESYGGDGNNVVEVHALADRAIRQAREGGGPTLLEFKTYRWREHCGPNYDNDLGYRGEGEFLTWKKHCCIEGLGRRLVPDGVLSARDIEGMASEIEAEMDEAVTFARSSPFPMEQTLMENVHSLSLIEGVLG